MDSFYDVSLVIIDRNCSVLLERCVRSCTAQSYPGRSFEIVLLHDGKNPVVADVIDNYNRRHPINAYLTEMTPEIIISSALKHSSGRFILFVDSEDFISDYMLFFQTVFLYDNPSFGGVSVDYWLIDKESDTKLERVDAKAKPIIQGIMFKKDLLLKISRSEGPTLVYESKQLTEIIMRNAKIGYLPISFYRKSMIAETEASK